tara:strand:- start:4230 stop:5462 length:1233 start_codon:yes stop_codon:yes gene_type:complete
MDWLLKRKIFAGIVFLFVLLGVYSYSRSDSSEPVMQAQYRTIKTAKLVYNDYSPVLRLIAEVENPGFTAIHVNRPGRVDKVFVRPSEKVKIGQKLACLTTEHQVLDLKIRKHECDMLHSQLSSAKKERSRLSEQVKHSEEMLANSQKKYQRAEQIYKKKHLSAQQFEREKSTFLSEKSKHHSIESQLEKLDHRMEELALQIQKCDATVKKQEIALKDSCIYSPGDGQVVEVLIAPGAMIGSGTDAIHISTKGPKELHSMVLSSQLEQIQRGVKSARFADKNWPLTYKGVVDAHTAGRKGFEVIFGSDADSIFQGQAYDVFLELLAVKKSLLIPSEMIYHDRFIYGLEPVIGSPKMKTLKKYPVTCFGYQWNKMLKKRLNVCQVDHKGPLPNLALKTRLEGAMGGMLVEVE